MSNLSGATTAVFIVSLSAALEVPVTVAWQTKDGTAKAGTDYEAASGSVTFEPGQTEKQVQVVVYGRAEGDTETRTFSIQLYPPENAILDQQLTEVEIQVTDSEGVPITSLVVATGPRGVKGDPGLSSYELAKLQGYEGTLEEYIQQETAAGISADRAEQEADRSKTEADRAKTEADKAQAIVDADGTFPDIASGIAGTPNQKYFRVIVNDSEGVTVAFLYYLNNAGTAVFITSTPNERYLRDLQSKFQNTFVGTDLANIFTFCDAWGYEISKITEQSFETKNLRLVQTSEGPILEFRDEYGNAITMISPKGAQVIGNNELVDSKELVAFADDFGNEFVFLDQYGRTHIGDNIVYETPDWIRCTIDQFGYVIEGVNLNGDFISKNSSGGTEPVPSVLETSAVGHWLFGRVNTSYKSRVGTKQLTPQSTPEFNENFVSVASWGGALVSDIPDAGEYTVCAVVRVPQQAAQSDCVVIYGTQNGYSLRDDDDTYTGNQLSMFSDRDLRRWLRSKISGYLGTSRQYPTLQPPVGEWLFVSHVVKLTGSGKRFQVLSVSGEHYQELREADSDKLILSGRNIAVGNAYCDVPMFKTKGLDIAEFIYFDSALSQQDVKNVYLNSRQRMAERSINLV